MKKIFLVYTLFLVVFPDCSIFAQSNTKIINNLLNSCLNRTLKIGFDSGCRYSVSHISVQQATDMNFVMRMEYKESVYSTVSKYCRLTIKNPYYVKNGEWRKYRSEYQQEGNLRIVTISGNPDYLTEITLAHFDTKNSEKLLDNKLIKAFKLEFPDEGTAEKFVIIINEIQGNKYNNTPWLRTQKESNIYSNYSSKELYAMLAKDFREYEIQSEQVHSWEDTYSQNFKFRYNHPNIVITYTDSPNFDYGPNFKAGTFTISIPIYDATFENAQGWFGGNDEKKMMFYSKSGITVLYKGKKTLTEEYYFYSSKIICNNILSKLRVFKKKVLSEGFKGKYGYSPVSPQVDVQPKKILDKYEQ